LLMVCDRLGTDSRHRIKTEGQQRQPLPISS
jgi:hypothetical protein